MLLQNCDILFIFKTLEEDDVKAEIKKIENMFSDRGRILKVDLWGKKKLPFEKHNLEYGFYGCINVELDVTMINEIGERLRSEENVFRHMIIKKGSSFHVGQKD